MNQKKAKAIRQAVGFIPSEKRTYRARGASLVATGTRAQYQRAKRILARLPRF